ncbi:MAG TPA: helix-turn-helix domain-containing protein [Caulobacteraceae bacterium]|nr:helix-turn-helix domain-containing protein [Caulobacteraceae bacterium]
MRLATASNAPRRLLADLDIPAVAGAPELASVGRGFTMSFGPDEEIFGDGEEADFAYQVVSGAARTFRVLADGRRQVVGFHLPGESFGLEPDASHHVSAESVGASEIRLVARRRLDMAAHSDAAVARWLWRQATGELDRLRGHVMLLGRQSAAEKVGAFLLEMARRTLGADAVELPMTRMDIADYLGLALETVSRTLAKFEREGAISMPSCRRIHITNAAALSVA